MQPPVSYLYICINLGFVVRLLCLGTLLTNSCEAQASQTSIATPASERIVFSRSDQLASALGGPVLFIAERDLQAANFQSRFLQIVSPDGSNLVDLKTMGTDPSFSPDGKQIAFSSNQSSNRFQIAVISPADRKVRILTHLTDSDAFTPAWSPDGKRIAFCVFRLSHPFHEPSLYVMDADGGNAKKIADHAAEPSWAPDGKRIAFTSSVDGKYDIATIRDDGSDRKQLSSGAGENASPAWSPDGATIAFASDRKGRSGIFLMNPDGSDLRAFVFSKKEEFCFPAWSRQGNELAFTSLIPDANQARVLGEELPKCRRWSGEYQIYRIGPDGKNPRRVTPKAGGLEPSYGIAAN